jgi:excinuclease ABC subunit A
MLPIVLAGARTHNLKDVDLELAPGSLVALTGPSGAGKSSLALDTLYAEGQRRFVESFSPYARQFLERLERPPTRSLDPIAATVAVDRRAPVKSSRSTLATLADLEPYLAALFGAEAIPTCPDCGVPAVPTSARDAAARVASAHDGKKAVVTYVARARDAEEYLELREALLRDGYRRLFVAGQVKDIDDVRPSEVTGPTAHVEVVVDRVTLAPRDTGRIQQALEAAWARADGRAEVRTDDGHVPLARGLVCPRCARAFEPARPGLFSYNSPLGACADCRGFGRVIGVDWAKVIPDPSKSLADGAIRAWNGSSAEWERKQLAKFCKREKIPMDAPWASLTRAQQRLVLDGEGTWQGGKYPGVRAWFKWLESRTYKMHVRVFLARFREYTPCESCGGSRLNAVARTYRVADLPLGDWHALTVAEARAKVDGLAPRSPQGARVKGHLGSRLRYLDRVGLGYLALDRQARTLSGGEAQRAALTTALGAELTGTLFVLDEPTVGLHASDVAPLAEVARELSEAGNTVLVIEHDERVVRACDRVVELGPGAGERGGTILYDGPPAGLDRRPDTPTGRAWAHGRRPARTPRPPKGAIELRGVTGHNLAGLDVDIPKGIFVAITGPSGSGKSSLAEDALFRAVARATGDTSSPAPLAIGKLKGLSGITRAVLVDQSPLGRTARGNPATYTKAWDRIRARLAAEPSARSRGLGPAQFSFNVGSRPGVTAGRCEACSGEGYETVEMQFLADVMLLCPVCQGKRFRPEVLAAKLGGLDASQILGLTVDDAIARYCEGEFYDPVLRRALEPVSAVGLGYLGLGQPLPTLSGGEAQRLKLARALGMDERDKRGALFVVDEPSAGLHAEDAAFVVRALDGLVDAGASVVMVEHDLDVIAQADWVIDLGPGGGPAGGRVVAEGPPREIARSGTRTGVALAAFFGDAKRPRARKEPARPPRVTDAALAISVHHAREHNLKDVSCRIPHGSLAVVTGPSGSGKSSLAFDVVFAEGQRRFMETLTPYARQFLPTLPRPDVDSTAGIPPSIALEQRTTRAGGASTVATVTEVAHYLRLLYAKVGEVHCPKCDAVVSASSPDELFERFASSTERAKYTLYAPAVRARKGTYLDLFTQASRAGVQAARVDRAIVAIEPPPKLEKAKEHSIDLIVHYGALAEIGRDAFDRALAWGEGMLRVGKGAPTAEPGPGETLVSTSRTCGRCGTGVPDLDPRWFSFATKQGRCDTCDGEGTVGEAPDDEVCPACGGDRLSPVPRKVRLQGETYGALGRRSVASALAAARSWRFEGKAKLISQAAVTELVRRLAFIDEVGLGYLALDRRAGTLSGGEMQRLRLSAQLGAGLTGALYVLDEPTIGLHPRDTARLVGNLRALTKTGSTVVVVEHDAETIRAADHLIDLGPKGGREGGHILAEGPATEVLASPRSFTARALSESGRAERPARPPARQHLALRGARANNLQGVDLRVPIGRLTAICGVSGSGKSTLVRQVLYPALRRALGLVAPEPGPFTSLSGHDALRRAIAVDQSPIGRTPRSIPATFLGIWDDIRRLFAGLPEAKVRGFGPARFSFNTSGGGRCPACEGQGAIVHEMAFLPDVVHPCEACQGARFEPQTLEVRYRDASIGDVLRLSAEDAAALFESHRRVARPLRTLCDLGVGYIQIGQGSNTLSGGEAQRLKLAAELTAGSQHEPTLYVLDEPTTGLHLADVRRLMTVMDELVARGDTLVVIEHHPDVVACADWAVELGPEAGERGGRIVFEGTPAELAKAKTATGRVLAGLGGRQASQAARTSRKGRSSHAPKRG